MDRGTRRIWRIIAAGFMVIWLAGLATGNEQSSSAWACGIASYAVSRTYGGDA